MAWQLLSTKPLLETSWLIVNQTLTNKSVKFELKIHFFWQQNVFEIKFKISSISSEGEGVNYEAILVLYMTAEAAKMIKHRLSVSLLLPNKHIYDHYNDQCLIS